MAPAPDDRLDGVLLERPGGAWLTAARFVGLGLVLLLPVGVGWFGWRVLSERRELLLRGLSIEVTRSAASLSALVRERASQLEYDLSLVADTLKHHRGRDEIETLIEPQLQALDRTQPCYLSLWYVRDGELGLEVSGDHPLPTPVPKVALDHIEEAESAARAHPGAIVRTRAGEERAYDHLRLFAYAPTATSGTIVVLVSLDTLFEALQRRAQLPGTELWVVDEDGTLLVDPTDGRGGEDVLAVLASPAPAGSQVLGPIPSLRPFSHRGHDSRLVAWQTNRRVTFGWTTAIVVSLGPVAAEVGSLSVQLMLLLGATVLLVAAAAGIAVALERRQRALQDRVETLTRVSRLREQLIRAEKLSTFGQIAAGVAHEIGTPLGVVSLRVDHLLEQARADGERERLRGMKEQLERISRIIRQLLEYARPQSAARQSVAVRAAVERVAALVDTHLRRKRLSLINAVPAGVLVAADLDQLHQVMLNLVVNAADACAEGGRISLGVRDPGTGEDELAAGRLGLTVADDGCGIPAELRATVFEPFVTTKPPGEGTGLGLTIVKDIVEGHGGRVMFESSAAGTRFTLWWPRAEANVAPALGEVA